MLHFLFFNNYDKILDIRFASLRILPSGYRFLFTLRMAIYGINFPELGLLML